MPRALLSPGHKTTANHATRGRDPLLGEDLGDQPPDACSKNDCSMPRGRSSRLEWPKDKATSIKKSVKSRCGGACAAARSSAMRDKRDEKKGQRTFPRRDTHHCASLGPTFMASPTILWPTGHHEPRPSVTPHCSTRGPAVSPAEPPAAWTTPPQRRDPRRRPTVRPADLLCRPRNPPPHGRRRCK